MTSSYLELPISAIDATDKRFQWNIPQESLLLEQSLRKYGLLYPLLVQEQSNHTYRLLDGFRRFTILQQQHSELSLTCHVLSRTLSIEELLHIRLSTIVAIKLGGLQIFQIVRNFAAAGCSLATIAQKVLPQLQQKTSLQRTREFLQLSDLLHNVALPSSLLATSVEDWLPLLRFSEREISAILVLSQQFQVGGKKWKTLLQLLDEVRRLRQQTITELLHGKELQKILTNPQLQPPVCYRLFKQQLEQWRYPQLSAMRHEFERCRKQLHLPAKTQIHEDPFFEKDNLLIKIQASSYPELQKHLQPFTQNMHQAEWERMFAIVQGEWLAGANNSID